MIQSAPITWLLHHEHASLCCRYVPPSLDHLFLCHCLLHSFFWLDSALNFGVDRTERPLPLVYSLFFRAGNSLIQSGPTTCFLHHEHASICCRYVPPSLDRLVSAPFWPSQSGMILPYFAVADAWLYACLVFLHLSLGVCWLVHSRRLTWSSL